jgi:excisionase family DNA binding protein
MSLEYWTAEDVAGVLKVSAKSIYRWALQDPTLPQIRIGGVVRFPRERVERWLRAREGPVAPRSLQPLPSVADEHAQTRDAPADLSA